MEIFWHCIWTLSRVHGSHYGTCSKCLYFLATPHNSASDLLGQTLGWVNRANDRKDRLFQSSQGFWCPLVHNTLQVPHMENPKRWNPANMVASSRRRKGRKRCPWKRSCSQARLSRDVRVWVAGPCSWNDCWLSVSAHFEFRACKGRLTLARFPYFATFASGRRGGGGGWYDPPWRSAPDGRRASRKKTSRCVSTRSRDCIYNF